MVCRMPPKWDCGKVKTTVTLHRRNDKNDKYRNIRELLL